MNADTSVDLVTLHEAIVADIQAAFPALRTVEFYRDDRKTLPKPACLLEITEFENLEDEDPGTEQLCVMMKFEAELVISFSELQAKRSVFTMAAALANWLRKRRWSDPNNPGKKLPTGEALVIGAYRDDFSVMGGARDQDVPQFEVWRVEWQQRVHLGAGIWNDTGTPPGDVYTQGNINGEPDGGYQQVAGNE